MHFYTYYVLYIIFYICYSKKMNGKETQSQVVQDPGLTVDIRTEKWPQDARLQFNGLITELIPSAEMNEDSVSIPVNVLDTKVKL